MNTRPRGLRRSRFPRLGLPLLLFSTAAVAGAGDLDPTFGTGGRVFFNIVNVVEASTSIAQQGDGKLLIGRWVYYWPSTEDLSVVRLNSNGSLDAGFDGDGRTGVDLGSMEGSTRAVLALRDGRVIAAGRVAGYEDQSSSRFGVVRYAADGAVDRTFGSSGVNIESFGATHASIEAIVEQPDDRLVGAGYISAPGQPQHIDMLVVRFNADGSIDTTFGDAGRLAVDFSLAARDDAAQALVLQPDGKLVVAGYAFDASNARKIAILRLTPSGQPDATFGVNGRAEIPQSGTTRTAKAALQLQTDGRILLAAQDIDTDLEECTGFVARLNPDGSTDPSFGGGGIAGLSLGPCAMAGGSALAVEPGGAIVLANTAGTPFSYGPADIRVARVTALGEFDDTFGINGTAIVDMGDGWAESRVAPDIGVSMVLQSDGRIALTASDQFDWDVGGNYFVVARLLASGRSAGLIGLTETYIGVDEPAGSATFIVRRTGGAAGAVSVDFATSDDTASGGADFTRASGTLTWMDGETANKTITITVADDSVSEGNEYLELALSNPTGGASLTTSRAFINIFDDEPPPPAPPPNPSPGNPASGGSGGGGVGWVLILVLAVALVYRRALKSAARAHTGPSGRFSL